MLMPPSSEFVSLCQSQTALLTNSLGAALTIIYLTEELTEVANAKLVPVVAYPEAITGWGDDRIFTLLSQGRSGRGYNLRLLTSETFPADPGNAPVLPAHSVEYDPEFQPLQAAERALLRQQQMVIPLIHEEMVMGLLVTAREDRAWDEAEQSQIQKISDTLAIACFLDQRAQWLAQDILQQRLLREQRQDILDDLIHQFRNPLTALRTFGKLLIKRLRTGDSNRTVAEGIVRESDRLQELLKQLDIAVDLDDAEFRRLLSASSSEVEWNNPAASNQPRPSDSITAPAPLLLPGANILVGTTLQTSPQEISDVLAPLIDSAVAIAQDRQLDLQFELPENLPNVLIDVRAMREVLNNLIDNALKYTPAGGHIYIGARSHLLPNRPQQQAIIVADTGPGIPTQDLQHLFERHYRGVQAETDIPGTGLGLAIARDLVRQMHGEIEVFSPVHTSPVALPSPAFIQAKSLGTAVVVWLSETT